MSETPVSISNKALDEVPAQQITSFEENSHPANVCRRQYAQAVGEVLERAAWGHSRRWEALALNEVNDREGVWSYSYALPNDMLLPLRVFAYLGGSDPEFEPQVGQRLSPSSLSVDDPGAPYDYAGETLYTNVPDAWIEFVESDPAVDLFGPLIIKAIVLNLASKIVVPIKADRRRQGELIQMFEVAMERAMASDANRRRLRYGDNYVPDEVIAREGFMGMVPGWGTPWGWRGW